MNMFTSQTFGKKDFIHWIPRIIVVIIIGQTLPFKYIAAEESVMLFSSIGWEPHGRILIAVIETIAIVLLVSRYYIAGAILSLSIISAANFLHFVKLGFIVNDDGGALFVMSIIVILCSLWVVIYWNRNKPVKQVTFDTPEMTEEDL